LNGFLDSGGKKVRGCDRAGVDASQHDPVAFTGVVRSVPSVAPQVLIQPGDPADGLTFRHTGSLAMSDASNDPHDAIDVHIAELLVATTDEADVALDQRIQQVLRLLKQRTGMDVVFVSQFTEGRRVFRFVEQVRDLLAVGGSDPLEESWCQRVVDGRLPQVMEDAARWVDTGAAPPPGIPVGTHLSVPIVMGDGEVYGTLCCFSFLRQGEVDPTSIKRLHNTARLLARTLDPVQSWPELPQD
jgi:hypothetical protein